MVTMGICPDCGGSRLNSTVLSCRIGEKNIAEVTSLAIPDILNWLQNIDDPLANDLKQAIRNRLGYQKPPVRP
ncbi:putative uncharacterized protein [Parabacteroides johnsonii CAG:246]|nr:putative uncharacterized protein [Parabacteroides johnsonii CAG:246]